MKANGLLTDLDEMMMMSADGLSSVFAGLDSAASAAGRRSGAGRPSALASSSLPVHDADSVTGKKRTSHHRRKSSLFDPHAVPDDLAYPLFQGHLDQPLDPMFKFDSVTPPPLSSGMASRAPAGMGIRHSPEPIPLPPGPKSAAVAADCLLM